jgi:hypothetical protein
MNHQGQAPHRGVIILVLGILGLIVCPLIAPVAWIMGKGDLAQIDAGQMDPEGRGMTQAGMIIGIAGTIFLVLSLFVFLLLFVLGGAASMASV